MIQQRYACFNLSIVDQLKSFELDTYSLFKYGSGEATLFFVEHLKKLVTDNIPTITDGTWCIASAAYKKIPTASYFLTQSLNRIENIGCQLEQIHIIRDIVYPEDYAVLNEESRHTIISQIRLQFPKERLKGKNLLVIDDALVTGAHEKILFEQLSPYVNSICFAYIVDVKELKSATLESTMNNTAIQSIFDLEDIIDQGNYALNARTVKYLLGYPNATHFNYFLMRRSKEFVNELYAAACHDGYAYMVDFNRNMLLLRSYHKKIARALLELSV
jgi:hypothetical protein